MGWRLASRAGFGQAGMCEATPAWVKGRIGLWKQRESQLVENFSQPGFSTEDESFTPFISIYSPS